MTARTLMMLSSLLLFAGLSGCTSSPTVDIDHDPSANFTAYRTYAWAKKPEGGSPLGMQRVVAGIDSRLQAKGWSMASPETADIALIANVATQQQQDIDTMYSGMGPGWGYGWGWGGGMATTTVRNYTVGTLILDMFDAKTKQGVWRGTASGTVSDSSQTNQEQLNKALDKMFVGFPPGSAPPAN